MVRCLFVLAWLTACGRLEFDERETTIDSAPPGHDEDGDGIGDLVDPCPHLAGDAADRDRDGVGDQCDPDPDAPTSRFVVFSTMQAGDQPFAAITAFDQEADAIHTATMTTGMSILGTFATVRVDIGFEIRGLVGSTQHQVASGVDGGSSVYYFTEINENGSIRNVSVTSFDNMNGYLLLGGMNHNGMHAGVGLLRYDATLPASGTPSHQLVAGWTGELYTGSAATPMYQGGTEIRVVLNGLDVAIRYVVVIATN